MTGTTGVTSDGTTLYVATNYKITKFRDTTSTNIALPTFKTIGGLTTDQNKVYGYATLENTKYVLFSMDSNDLIQQIEIDYIPVAIVYTPNFELCVITRKCELYLYDQSLVSAGPMIDVFKLADDPNRKVNMIEMFGYPLISYDTDVYFGVSKTNTVSGIIHSMAKYGDYMLLTVPDGLGKYKILQYGQTKIRELPGDNLEAAIYSCVHKNSLYVSTRKNAIYPLVEESSNQEWWSDWWWKNKSDQLDPKKFTSHVFQSYTTNYDPIKMKAKEDAIVIEKKHAEKKVSMVYVWIILSVLLMALLGSMISGNTPPVLYVLLFLTGTILFLITTIL